MPPPPLSVDLPVLVVGITSTTMIPSFWGMIFCSVFIWPFTLDVWGQLISGDRVRYSENPVNPAKPILSGCSHRGQLEFYAS